MRFCPACLVERADFETACCEHLPECPNCGSAKCPVVNAELEAEFSAAAAAADADYRAACGAACLRHRLRLAAGGGGERDGVAAT